jgi:hypothetical protein
MQIIARAVLLVIRSYSEVMFLEMRMEFPLRLKFLITRFALKNHI